MHLPDRHVASRRGLLGTDGCLVEDPEVEYSAALHRTGDLGLTGRSTTLSAWGRGYAPEAARECLGREEIVSFTGVGNTRSRAVMEERLGMRQIAIYDHPIEGRAALPQVCYLSTRRARQMQA